MTKAGLRVIAVLALPGVQLLDVSGPLDVFAEANAQIGAEAYKLVVIASEPGAVRSSSGVRLVADWVVGQDHEPKVDTLLVAGCPHAPDTRLPSDIVTWLRQRAGAARRYGSVCSGAFFLAEAGLLDNRRVTTHWSVAERFTDRFPDVIVEEDAIYVSDGPVRTAAGVTAGLDLALSLVVEDLGDDVGRRVASQLVMFFKRPGGQLQFSRKGEAVPAGRAALQELQRWVASNPELDHSVAKLAERLQMSRRHLTRLFRSEVDSTPASWVEGARVVAARRYFEQGTMAPKQVAVLCGFADVDTFRRAFSKDVGVTPADYRKRFSRVQLDREKA